MFITIIRDEQTEQGALGKLYIEDDYFCETLQPDEAEAKKFYIPEGMYKCKRFSGFKWKNTFEIIVEGHTALLFHSGNVEADSLGCILLGSERGKLKGNRAVLNSGNTFKKFMDKLKYVEEFDLYITDQYYNAA